MGDYQQKDLFRGTGVLTNVTKTIELACDLWDSSSFNQSVGCQEWRKRLLPMMLLSRAIINTPTISESVISTRGNP
jgi:hypothetical protein